MSLSCPDHVKEFFISGKYSDFIYLNSKQKSVSLGFIKGKNIRQLSQEFSLCTTQIKNILRKSFRIVEFYLKEKSTENLIKESVLSGRAKNVLIGSGFERFNELDGFPMEKLIDMRNFGEVTLSEIIDYLKELGITLKPCDRTRKKNKYIRKKDRYRDRNNIRYDYYRILYKERE